MSIVLCCVFLLAFTTTIDGLEEPKVALATLLPRGVGVTQNIVGSVLFTETDDGVEVKGSIIGLPAGNYGFHVHEKGDITTCDASGAHFDPNENNHGGREHGVRHVGDLGNVVFVGNGNNAVATIDFKDNILALRGRNSILGRTLVLHEQEDDLGLGGHETSLTTGNAGPRVACGIIELSSSNDSGNAASTVSPSLFLFLAVAIGAYLHL